MAVVVVEASSQAGHHDRGDYLRLAKLMNVLYCCGYLSSDILSHGPLEPVVVIVDSPSE